MLISPRFLSNRLEVAPRAVCHVGAHLGQEADRYRDAGWSPRVWVEASPGSVSVLERRFSDSSEDLVVAGAVWRTGGLELTMNLASNEQSSSLLEPTLHHELHPDVSFRGGVVVRTRTLDDILAEAEASLGVRPDLLVLDVQGAEARALLGLTDYSAIRWIYTEIALRPLYAEGASLVELDDLLGGVGFHRVATLLIPLTGWGEALYVPAEHARRLEKLWRTAPVSSRAFVRLRLIALGLWFRFVRLRSALRRSQRVE